MAKWYVSIPTHASMTIEVEAESETEAIDKACEELDGGLCHHCASFYDIGEPIVNEATAEIID